MKSLKQEYDELHAKKQSLVSRCEEYSRVTLPYVFPKDSTGDRELQSQLDSLGARGVNFLTNKLVMTLFPEDRPFFRLQVSSAVLKQLTDVAKAGDEQAAEIISKIDSELSAKEKEAVQSLGYTRFRTEATSAARLLIVTGNCVVYHPIDDAAPQVYNVKDYCVKRDLSGNLLTLITRDKKGFGTFSNDVQEKLQASRKKQYESSEEVTLYTKVTLQDDGRYHLSQSIENVPLDAKGVWTKDELPWKVLAWNLLRGEDYGHGLVEDHYGALNALCILTQALVTGVAVAAEIKFLVDPASMLDIKTMNESSSGSYHTGKKDDVTCVQVDKTVDFQIVIAAIERLERQLSAVFLMNSSVPRNAERVTAEEIRYVAQELETSNAGVYSRLATEWQYPTAIMLLSRIGAKIGKNSDIQPQIITGIDALSRAGDLDNFRALISDLGLLNTVPEEIRAGLDVLKLVEFLALRRGVDYMKFTKSEARMAQEAQAEAQQQQAMIQQQAQADMAVQGTKALTQR